MNTDLNEPEMPDLDYSDSNVVIGNIQALEMTLVRLLYIMRAKGQLMDSEAEYCLSYDPVAAIQTPDLGSTHDISYQSAQYGWLVDEVWQARAQGAEIERFVAWQSE